MAGAPEENLTVYGDGSQTRSFCYVSDEVDGIRASRDHPKHEPVNIGNPKEFTILECARKVIATTGSASEVKFEALPQDDPKQRRPDIAKAKRLLGWEPKVDLETGLKLSLEYFRQAVAERQSRPSGVAHPVTNCSRELRAAARSLRGRRNRGT